MKQSSNSMLNRLEARLERLGPAWATIAILVAAALAAFGVHVVLLAIEGRTLNLVSVINIPTECMIVATPLILYSRRTIKLLAHNRAELQAMSRQLQASADAAQETSQAKSAFLANMSHELRTPLNAILGFSEIMKDQHLGPVSNPRYLSYAGDIHASGRHLLGIINDVLDLAKIESGKMSLDDAEDFALVPALSTSLTMLAGLGEKSGVTVRGEWGESEVHLVAVERMLRQIIINLVGNAIKFTPAGGSVLLSGEALAEGGYALRVRDTGIGMSESEISNALIPFGQNRTNMAVRHEGTGLGLPLAKAMIELHGGSLAVESRPNHGTCVTMIFPASRVARGRKAAA